MSEIPDATGAGGRADLERAAREAAAAVVAAPTDPRVLLHAAATHLRAGDATAATTFAEAAVAADRTSFRALRVLSGLLNMTGQRGEAIRRGLEAVRLDPDQAEVRLHVGAMLAAERRWREAAEHLAVHVASPDGVPVGWAVLSSVLQEAGSTDRAAEAIRHAIAAEPDNPAYRLRLASLLCACGLHDEALEELAVTLRQAPGDALAWRIQSGVFAAVGRLPEALAAAEHAAALAGDDPDCRAHLEHVSRMCNVPVAEAEAARMPAAAAGDPERWRLAPRRARPVRPPRPAPGLADDIAVRWRVIHALMLRDIRTRFGHTRLGYLWAILEPISHLLTLGLMFYALNHSPPPLGDNMFLFYITGLVPFLMFSHVSNDVMGAVEGGNAMLQLPVVKRTDVMVAHALRQLATELVVGMVIFSTAALLGVQGLPADLLTASAAIGLLWLLAVGIGAINVVLFELFPAYDTFYAALIRLLYFTSGIYYSPVGMPDWVRDWLLWNPVLQGIDFFRGGFFRQYEPHWLDIGYLSAWAVGSIGLGFALERATRARRAVHT